MNVTQREMTTMSFPAVAPAVIRREARNLAPAKGPARAAPSVVQLSYQRMNLRTIDLNLFVIFEALMAERSVKRAAQKVGLSPSALSHGLGRLRAVFNDDLFLRGADGLVPTRRALDLIDPVRGGLKQIQHALADHVRFDPQTSQRAFKIQFHGYLTGALVPGLCARAREQAPGVKLIVEDPSTAADMELDDPGNIQIRIGSAPALGEDYKRDPLFEDRLVLALRRDHPVAGRPLTLDTLCDLSYIEVLTPSRHPTKIDDLVRQSGLDRRIALETPHPSLVVPIISQTDLGAFLPEQWVRLHCNPERIVILPLPLPESSFTVEQVWHVRNDRDPGHRWLRNLIAEAGKAVLAATARRNPAG